MKRWILFCPLLVALAGCPAPTPTPTAPKATESTGKQTTAKATESSIKPPNPDPGK